MENTAMQHSFTFIILDKIILQNKKQARWRRRKMWQVKEMEEVYGVADFMSEGVKFSVSMGKILL